MIGGDETSTAIPEETPGRLFLRWRPAECKVKLWNFCFKYATHKKRIHSKRNTRHSNPPPASNRVQSCVGSSCLLNFNAMQCYNVFSATNVYQNRVGVMTQDPQRRRLHWSVFGSLLVYVPCNTLRCIWCGQHVNTWRGKSLQRLVSSFS